MNKAVAPMSTSSITDQHSRLLRLPAEIKSQIFELIMPTNTTIILRAAAARQRRRRHYVFRPLPPAILATCRELRAEFSALYYATNTFLFSDTMFQPQALRLYAAARLEPVSRIRRVKVVHQIHALFAFLNSDCGYRHPRTGAMVKFSRYWDMKAFFRVRFTASHTNDGAVEVSGLAVEHHKELALLYKGDEDGLCCCTLQSLVEKFSGKEGGGVMAMLAEYARLVRKYTALVDDRLRMGEGASLAAAPKTCRMCRKIKAI